MIRWLGPAFALAILMLLAACAPAEDGISVDGVRLQDGDLIRGQILYVEYCAGCHGVKGEGQFPADPLQPSPINGLYGAPPHDVGGHTWHHSDVVLVRYVIEGGFTDQTVFYHMPGFGDRLTLEDARSIIGYIKTLWTEEQRMMQTELTEAENAMMAGQ